MKKTTPPLLLSIVFCSTLAMPVSSIAGIKCWTNRDGVRECGNMVPPEYAQKETRTVDKHGITTDVNKRAPTKAELAERERQKAAEQKRLEEEKRQEEIEAKRREKQAKYDRVLLATFLTEEDIIRSRDRKVSAIDASIELTNITKDKLQEKLEKEKQRAAKIERQGKPASKNNENDIKSLQKQIDEKKKYVASKQREKKELITKYAADLERFRELKAEGRKLR